MAGYDRAMLPMKNSTIFKSRWFALLWAAGIIWTAIDVAGGSGDGGSTNNEASTGVTDATGAPVDNQQMEQIGAALNSL
ncbi:MAG: hypothetical protein ABIR51_10155 [Sphingomicrobium sp.]